MRKPSETLRASFVEAGTSALSWRWNPRPSGRGGRQVWGAQTSGARQLGVPESTITAIREKHTGGMPPEDAQIVTFTRDLLQTHRIDHATFQAMQERFGPDQLIPLTGVIGYYCMMAVTVNACELEATEGAEMLHL